VELAAPLGPRNPKMVPFGTLRLRSSTAANRPKLLLKLAISISNIGTRLLSWVVSMLNSLAVCEKNPCIPLQTGKLGPFHGAATKTRRISLLIERQYLRQRSIHIALARLKAIFTGNRRHLIPRTDVLANVAA